MSHIAGLWVLLIGIHSTRKVLPLCLSKKNKSIANPPTWLLMRPVAFFSFVDTFIRFYFRLFCELVFFLPLLLVYYSAPYSYLPPAPSCRQPFKENRHLGFRFRSLFVRRGFIESTRDPFPVFILFVKMSHRRSSSILTAYGFPWMSPFFVCFFLQFVLISWLSNSLPVSHCCSKIGFIY